MQRWRRLRRLLADVSWLYPRRTTTAAVLAMTALAALAARALLPTSWRPPGTGWLVPAALAAYVVHRLGSHTGRSKQLKHAVIDPLGGDVDDAQSWALAGLTAAGVLVLVQVVQHVAG